MFLGGASLNESEKPMTHDGRPAHLRGRVCLVTGSLHAVYTMLESAPSTKTRPVDPFSCTGDGNSALRLSRGGPTCAGPGLASTSATVLVSCYLARLRSGPGPESKILPPASSSADPNRLHLLVLAVRYWFGTPAIGVAVGPGCFAAAWILALI